MRRWGWIFALLVSAGLNAGILATLWVTRAKAPAPPPHEAEGPAPGVRAGGRQPFPGAVPNAPPADPDPRPAPQEPQERPGAQPWAPPPGGTSAPPMPRPPDDPRLLGQGPDGPPLDDGPFGGENAEVGPEPGTVGPVPSIPPPRLREFADRLGVSGEKRERFFALQLRMMATMRAGRWRIQQLRREVRIEMSSERPDRKKIEANLAAIQNAQLTLEQQTVRTILDTREILDGEAERQYLEMITRMRLGVGDAKPNGRPRPRMDGGMPVQPRPEQDPRMNRPPGPRGGGFERPRPGPRGGRMLTPQERMERRRRFEEWQERQGAGQTMPSPQTSEPEVPPGT